LSAFKTRPTSSAEAFSSAMTSVSCVPAVSMRRTSSTMRRTLAGVSAMIRAFDD
jgi:hypothetical protein